MVNLKAKTLRKILLAGTAIVAAGAFGAGEARAQTAVSVPGGGGTWAANGTQGDDGTLAEAVAGADVNFPNVASNVVFTNNGVADDGSGLNSFNVGTITDSASTNNIFFQIGSANDLTVQTGAITISGDFFMLNGADDGDITVNAAGNVQSESFSINNSNATTADALDFLIAGSGTFLGPGFVSAGDNAGGGSTARLFIAGDATFNSSVNVNGGDGNATNTATLQLDGATIAFNGGLNLNDGAAGEAVLLLSSGANGQTVSGNIASGAAGEGAIIITNTHSDGVTFNGTIGSGSSIDRISVNNDGDDQTVTFANDVATTNGIELGDNTGGDTITANFGAGTAIQIDGVVTGGASETVNVNIIGGSTVNQNTGVWTGIDSLQITGGSTLQSGAAITAIGLVIDPGSTFVNSSGDLSAVTLNNGTLVVDSGAGNILGALSGSGTLDVDDSTFATSSVTQGLTTIGPGAQLGANGAVVSDVQLEGVGANILLDTGANSYTGNITATGASGTGAVFITDDGNSRTINGNLGTASSTLMSLSIASDAASSVIIQTNGNLYVDAVTLGENDTLRLAGSGTQTVSGAIVSSSDTGGTIDLVDAGGGAPTVVFNGVIGGNNNITDFLGQAGSHAVFNADATFDGVFRPVASAVTVASGVDVTAAAQADSDVTAWNVGVSPASTGQVIFTGDGVDLSNDSVNFLVSGSLAGVATLEDVFAGTMAAITTGAVVTDNSFLYDFSLVDDTNNVDVAVTVANTIADTVENPGFAEAGEILLTGALSGSTNPEIILLQSAIGSQTTQEGASKAIEAVTSPNIDGGALAAGLALANQTANLNSQRLASLRGGTQTAASSTGVSSGNATEGLSVWTQGFGAVGDQDDRGGVSGYDMTGFGLAFGADKQIFDETAVVGLAVAYAHTQVDSLGTANAETTIDSYQIALYGDYDLTDRTYIAGQVNYVWSTNDTTRNPGGVSSLSAKGDYDSSQIGARVELGHDFALGDFVLTPKALANYVYYDAGGYSETGAGGANLAVDSDAVNLFELGIGVDAAWDIENSDGSRIVPVLSAGVRHDFIGDNIQASNRFQAGGPAFRVEGSDPAQTTFNLGASVSYLESEHWEVTADYDFEAKSGYQSHNGFVRVSYRF